MRQGIGLGVGINRSNYAQGIFGAYRTRVIADGGVVEAGVCVDAVSSLLQTASLLLVPSGYKSGVAYSEIPTNGNGDLTWSRAGTGNRTNSLGNIELMGSGVPRLSYMYGSCPALLAEPQRTNSIRNSTAVGASTSPSTLPTNYAISGLTSTVVGIGTENGLSYVDIRLSGTASGVNTQVGLETPTAINASNAQTWTQSVYLKLINTSAPPTAYNMRLREGTAGGSFVADGIVSISPTTTLQRFTYTRTNTGTLTERIQPILLFDQVAGNSYDYTIRIAQPQLELGAYATTPIFTSGSTATRVADLFSRSNIYTNGLISASGGTWFVELRNNIVYTRDAASYGLALSDQAAPSIGGGASGNTLAIIRTSTSSVRLQIIKQESLTFTSLFTTTTDIVKIAIKWNGSTADVFVNGTKQVSATAFTATQLQNLLCLAIDVPLFIQQMALFPTPLSDAQCTTLTT